jgi:DNA-directed RNA polymerase subunit RPC12/RpoP
MPSAPELDQEPQYRCTHCSRLLYQDELARFACRVCEDRAGKNLRALPDLYADLGGALIPSSSASRGARVGASKTAPLPVALQPLHLRTNGGIVTELQAIEDSWRKAAKRTVATFSGSSEQTLATTVTFLRINLQWACWDYEGVADDLDSINKLYWQAKNTITGEQPRLITVHCRYLFDDSTECGEPLQVDINRTSAKCQVCGTRWGQAEWMGLFEATRQHAA